MKKFLMIATSAFMVCAAIPAFATGEAPATSPAAEAPKGEAPHDGKGIKGRGLFERGDTDGDGAVSKAEFLAQSEAQFKVLDTDGDGKITKAEIEEKRQKMKEMREKRKKQTTESGQAKPPAAEGTSE